MARGSSHTVQRALRRIASNNADERSDGELLARFVTQHDADAFRKLLLRHGPMVLGVCGSLLRCEADAEDAFQATFLVLARRAATIRSRGSVASWLHGVAYRTARKAQAAFARRQKHEPHAARPEATTSNDLSWREVQEVLHEELNALSEQYRIPLVLCYLQGNTLDETATHLGLAKNTVKARLERGRAVLRARLVRRGLAPAVLLAAVWPGVTTALPPALVESTITTATGAPASAAVVALSEGVLSGMRTTKLKLAAATLAVLAAVGLSLAGLAQSNRPTTPAVQKKNDPAAAPVAVAPVPREVAVKEFDELVVVIKHSAFSSELSATIKIEANGMCWYEVAGRPAAINAPAWAPAKINHKLAPAQLRKLGVLLKETEWLAKVPEKKMQLHDSEYKLVLKREGQTANLSCMGEPEPYKALLMFLRSISSQEYLLYQLEWEPSTRANARHLLDTYVRSELSQSQARPGFEIDYNRFVPWATRLVRKPFDRPTEDVATAVRLVGLLKLESEREYLADLASDRDWYVREAVAKALGRMGGEKSVAVLRKMVRSTTEAPWELIKLGAIAVPTIAEVIGDGADPEQGERLVRAYLDHWKEVSKPIDAKILAAARAGVATPQVKAYRTQYYEEFLKKAAESDREKKE